MNPGEKCREHGITLVKMNKVSDVPIITLQKWYVRRNKVFMMILKETKRVNYETMDS